MKKMKLSRGVRRGRREILWLLQTPLYTLYSPRETQLNTHSVHTENAKKIYGLQRPPAYPALSA